MNPSKPTVSALTGTTHLGYLDSLRALAAVFVVLHHSLLQTFPDREAFHGITKLALSTFYLGHDAVDFFIVLSGFCLMMPVARGDGTLRGGTLNFFKRRAWRILPTYYLAVGLSLLLISTLIGHKTGTHWDVSLPVTPKGIFTHLILMQDAFGEDATINHVLWSIAVEWRIYFLFPLLVWSWRRIGAGTTTFAALAASYILYCLCLRIFGASLSMQYLGLFALGMLSATVALDTDHPLHRLKRLPWGWLTLAGFAAIAFLTHAKVWHGNPIPQDWTDYMVGLTSTFLLIRLATQSESGLTRALNYQPLVFIGTFAYSIYLVHAPLIQLLWQYPFAPLQTHPLLMLAALVLGGTPIMVALSYLFFLACERPFLTRGRRPNAASLATQAALEPAP